MLFQRNDIAPAGGGVLAFVGLFHGAGEDIGTSATLGLGVLLGGDDYGLGAVNLVDAGHVIRFSVIQYSLSNSQSCCCQRALSIHFHVKS